MMAIAEHPKKVPLSTACDALNLCRAGIYRLRSPAQNKPHMIVRPPSVRRLSHDEQQQVLDCLHSEEFVDKAPTEVYATLLSRGVYHASTRTMYRILARANECNERRRQRAPQRHVKPVLTASRPNQVWTWDITKLCGPEAGVFYNAYVIIDLFSRYVVGWIVAETESKDLAKQLFAETLVRQDIQPQTLVSHSDRGSPMTSDTLAQLYVWLGVERSLSRPRVSNDNAFSEAQFKTLKYQPDYPQRFMNRYHAQAWLEQFFGVHYLRHVAQKERSEAECA